jgi:hypothetical protein
MTAGVDPLWQLDLAAPAQMYPSDAAIMRRAMELTLAALQRGQGARLVPLSLRALERFRVLGRLREARA